MGIAPGDQSSQPNESRLERWVPGVRIANTYQRDWLPRDLMAGLVLGALLVPQGLAYAELAGLPQITGLYATVVALVAYAAMGPSPFLVLGPDSSLAPMIAATVLPLAAGDPNQAVVLAGALAVIVGGLCAFAGAAKLGFIADLISKPVRIGYMAGLAITILVGQLPGLFGIDLPESEALLPSLSGLGTELVTFLQSLEMTNPAALAAGLLCLGVIFAFQRLAPNRPAILFGIVAAMAASIIFGLDERGVEVVGVLPQGFPRPQVPLVSLREFILLAGAAVGITIVSIGDTVTTSAGFAARHGYQMDSNRELVAIGSANLAAGAFQGFPISSSGSRTAVAEQSGARTQLTGLMAAALVLLMLVAFPGLVRDLPMSVLSAVIIVASVRLFDARGLARLWHLRPSEFAMAVASMLGVFMVGVLEGIVIAVLLSILLVFERAWRPYSAVLGEPEEVRGFHDVSRYPGAAEEPGLIILRWDAPLFFANANIFRDRIRALLAERPDTFWVVVAAEPVTDVDITASDMLIELDEELNAAGRHLVFAELKDPVKDRIVRYGLLETVSTHHFYPTIRAAVDEFHVEYAARPSVTDSPVESGDEEGG